jgi:hypothetical protein
VAGGPHRGAVVSLDVEHLLNHMRACPTRRHAIDILNEAEDFLRALPAKERDHAYRDAEGILEVLPDTD